MHYFKKIIYLIVIALVSAPSISYAHVKWFAKELGTARPYQITDTPVLIWLGIIILLLLAGVYLEKKLTIPKYLTNSKNKLSQLGHTIATIGFGLALIIFSFNNFLFAPSLSLNNTFLLALQAISGAMIVLGLYQRVAAIIIFLIFIFGINHYGFLEMLEAVEILGFGIYIFIFNRQSWNLKDSKTLSELTKNLQAHAVPLLRFFTGLNLIILGFSEKIFNPSLAQNFLTNYHWNFLQSLGWHGFTDYWFAFSAGIVEIIFGLFFILGLVTRLNTIVLAIFLITTLILLGPIELVGHIPHFSIALILLLYGSGTKLKIA